MKVKFNEWHAYWQVGLKLQEPERPWESMELRKTRRNSGPIKGGCAQKGGCGVEEYHGCGSGRLPSEGATGSFG